MKTALFTFYKALCLVSLCVGGRLYAEENFAQKAPAIELQYLPPNSCEIDPALKKIDPEGPKHFIHLPGFPREKNLTFSLFRPILKRTSRPSFEESFQIRKDGIIEGLQSTSHPYIVVLGMGFLPGERITASIRTKDGSIHEEVSFIPQPMRAESRDGKLSLEVELLFSPITTYRIYVKGIEEGEEYTFESRSGGEVIKEKRIFKAEDTITSLPGVIGKRGGNGTVFITNKNGSEVSIKMPWGEELVSYSQGKTYYPD